MQLELFDADEYTWYVHLAPGIMQPINCQIFCPGWMFCRHLVFPPMMEQ